MKKFISWKIAAVILGTLVLGFYDLPGATQKAILPFTPDSITENKIHLGLDLQGGSQLDYKIDLRKVPESDQKQIIDGVVEVIERRVNGLGVAEPNIYTSEIADENHIVVELANNAILSQEDVDEYLGEEKLLEELTEDEKKLVSLEKAKATVGKTIQLEFKEEKSELDPDEAAKIKENAQNALDRIKGGEDFSVVGQEEQQAYPGRVTYETSDYVFESDLSSSIADTVKSLSVGSYNSSLVESGGTFRIGHDGQTVEDKGLSIIKVLDSKDEVKTAKSVSVSHILITDSSSDVGEETERTEEEALKLAQDLKAQLEAGADFSELAKKHSGDASNSENGGTLSSPVTGDGTYVFDFEESALALTEKGQISEPVKTLFGYHLIKADEIQENVSETKYQYEIITYSTAPDAWQETGLTGEHFVRADIQVDQQFQPYVLIQFNDEGADLFEELTEKNLNKPIAIFVGGELISAPRVNQVITGGTAQITGQFTNDEAKALARDLNTGAIPAPIVLTGEYTIGATLGQEALNTSLRAGGIGLLLVMLFMAFYYRAAGILADLSLLIYAVIFIFLIKSQLPLSLSILIAMVLFAILVSKIVNSEDSGWEKLISFLITCVAFFFIIFLLKTAVVITLAGVAGIILSIGMAVDANILIFERFKEELHSGKSYKKAVESGFKRAWSAIRDSNFSTLITCGILFYFGSSIIRGFAFNLAAGILVSMITAITITRTLLISMEGKAITSNPKAFGVNINKPLHGKFDFIKKSQVWFSLSGILVTLSIVAITVFGLNLGLDFKGGTLMQFDFDESISKEILAEELSAIGNELTPVTPEETKSVLEVTDPEETSISEAPATTEVVDLSKAQILDSEENSYIVKTPYLDSATHNQILDLMKGNETIPSFTEARFTTIGPVIGATLLKKAMMAILVAIIVIVLYVAIAFRKVPKSVSALRFGACAIAALLHDVIIVTGIFTVLGHFLDVEINALFVTAMLTVFGYSVNDTIVVFDKLRENLLKKGDHELKEVANRSLNETLTRSMNTSISTLLALLSVLFFGSSSIFYFVLALTIGAVIGTYSSIFTASPLLVNWVMGRKKHNLE